MVKQQTLPTGMLRYVMDVATRDIFRFFWGNAGFSSSAARKLLIAPKRTRGLGHDILAPRNLSTCAGEQPQIGTLWGLVWKLMVSFLSYPTWNEWFRAAWYRAGR